MTISKIVTAGCSRTYDFVVPYCYNRNMNENEEPTMTDLAECETLTASALSEDVDWESLLPPVIPEQRSEWIDDEPVHDDRWDHGIPSWSAWA